MSPDKNSDFPKTLKFLEIYNFTFQFVRLKISKNLEKWRIQEF